MEIWNFLYTDYLTRLHKRDADNGGRGKSLKIRLAKLLQLITNEQKSNKSLLKFVSN